MKIETASVKMAMARKQLNQKMLADLMGVKPATVSKYMTSAEAPTNAVGLMADALGVDVQEILKEE